MFPPNFIVVGRISCGIEVNSKKRILEELGKLFAGIAPALTQDLVFDRLLERERLGSTGLGHGIALPHARMGEIHQAYGAFLQLARPVYFDAVDGAPVDLAFGLLVPQTATQEHLQLLANLANLFSDTEICTMLRRAADPSSILNLLTREGAAAGGS
jgi:nitrogen PTS system EIIA component